MTDLQLVARRLALGVVAAWAVLSALFAAFTLTEDWLLERMIALAAHGGASGEELAEMRAEYVAARGLDRPVHEQYVGWLWDAFTLQWGTSFYTGSEVLPMVASATAITALYVVPALLLGTAVGLAVGVYAALADRSLGAVGLRVAAYAGFGLLNGWVGYMVVAVFTDLSLGFQPVYTVGGVVPTVEPSALPATVQYGIPLLLVASTVAGSVASYARSYARGVVAGDLVKGVRARGGSRWAVVRHVVRNASIPLLSLAFAESLATLALAVFVLEVLFGLDGLGLLFYNAVWTHDLPVVTGATMVVVAVGVAGNVAQDVAYSLLDPRVDTASR